MIYLFDGCEFAGPELQRISRAHGDRFSPEADNFFLKEIDIDIGSWLAYYTLYKQDTLTMAHSLEGRVPYLDHRLVDLLASLPVGHFIRRGRVKMLLRDAMAGDLPRDILNAGKKAFYFPYHKLFGDSFRQEMEDLHSMCREDAELRAIINFRYFDGLIGRYSDRLDLISSKRLMVYLVFLIWYRHHFANG
jgi:asparagine synthase (glutamine-hydrolysing)